jgi:tetratricopeptide (TPR) repeat protein
MKSHETDNLIRALQCQNRALKIDPKYSMAWVNKGNILFNLGEPDEALKCYNTAIEHSPDYATAWLNKGEILIKLGRRTEAQECLERIRSFS